MFMTRFSAFILGVTLVYVLINLQNYSIMCEVLERNTEERNMSTFLAMYFWKTTGLKLQYTTKYQCYIF